MSRRNRYIVVSIVFGICFFVLVLRLGQSLRDKQVTLPDSSVIPVTFSGVYECLPLLHPPELEQIECTFGILSDDGSHYAVNFGQSADSMNQFKNKEHITAEGFIVLKESLSTNHWDKYNMKGIFTVTRIIR